MAELPDDFETIMRQGFGGRRLAEFEELMLEATTRPFYTEPIAPGRQEVLISFEALLQVMFRAPSHKIALRYQEQYLADLSGLTQAVPGQQVLVRGVESYLEREGLREWAVVHGQPSVLGAYQGWSIGPWFDLPAYPVDDPSLYEQRYGLFVAIGEPEVNFMDGSSRQLTDNILVPYHHGSPEMAAVYYQD